MWFVLDLFKEQDEENCVVREILWTVRCDRMTVRNTIILKQEVIEIFDGTLCSVKP
jgi:hypothetical protein